MDLLPRLGREVRVAQADRPAEARTLAGSAAADVVELSPVPGRSAARRPVGGSSGFAAAFAARGPRDGRGRSLRDFGLETWLFRYRCSYTIDAPAFDALPEAAREAVYSRLWHVLSGGDRATRGCRCPNARRSWRSCERRRRICPCISVSRSHDRRTRARGRQEKGYSPAPCEIVGGAARNASAGPSSSFGPPPMTTSSASSAPTIHRSRGYRSGASDETGRPKKTAAMQDSVTAARMALDKMVMTVLAGLTIQSVCSSRSSATNPAVPGMATPA